MLKPSQSVARDEGCNVHNTIPLKNYFIVLMNHLTQSLLKTTNRTPQHGEHGFWLTAGLLVQQLYTVYPDLCQDVARLYKTGERELDALSALTILLFRSSATFPLADIAAARYVKWLTCLTDPSLTLLGQLHSLNFKTTTLVICAVVLLHWNF